MRLPIFLTILVVLSGCVSNDLYLRDGVTRDQYIRDTVGCRAAATQAVPTNTQVGWAP